MIQAVLRLIHSGSQVPYIGLINVSKSGYKLAGLLLVKWYDKKMVKSPFNCVIFPLTQPQVARQQQQKKVSLRCNKKKCDDYFLEVIYYVEIYKFKI